ncbi:MAG: VOC family protein [Ascidiaceihabitans sp.]|nr:VOC family protein [Ascidiaceihabitans sp.]
MPTQNPFKAITAVDYTVIYARDLPAMIQFYETVLGFDLTRSLSSTWREYNIGANIFVLAKPGPTATDQPVPDGTAALQLAFKVTREIVDLCAAELTRQNVEILSPPTDRDFGHRTLFFRDPDGNLLEIYAEI